MKFDATELSVRATPDAGEIKAEYHFKNDGDKELIVLALDGECSCTSAKSDRVRYRPGESGVIQVTYVPKIGDSGAQQKKVTISTDDATTPVVKLVLKTELSRFVKLAPGALVWKESEAEVDKVISLGSSLGKILDVFDAVSLHGGVHVLVAKTGDSFEVKVRPTKTGVFEDFVRIRVTIENVGIRTYQVPAYRRTDSGS